MTEEWDVVPEAIVQNLILLMKKRCELFLEKNGDIILY